MPRDLDGPFTEESVRELFEHIENNWSRERAQAEDFLRLYWDEKTVVMPDMADKDRLRQFKAEKTTTREAMRIIDLLLSFYVRPADLRVKWRGDGQRSESAADKVERQLQRIYADMNPPFDSPRKVRVFQQLLYKGAQLGPMRGADAMGFPFQQPNETEREWEGRYKAWQKAHQKPPLVYRDLPTESTWPASHGLVNDLCLSTLELTYYDLQAMFGEEELARLAVKAAPRPSDRFTLALASNRQWLAYTVMGDKSGVPGFRTYNDVTLRQIRHRLGRSAIRIPPGLTRRRWSGASDRSSYWLSTLEAVRDMIVTLDRLASFVATGAKLDALPILLAHINDEERVRQWKESDIWIANPGDPSNPQAGREDVKAVYQAAFGQHTVGFLQWLHGLSQRVSGTGAMLEGLTSADTAWATRMAIDYATQKHSPSTLAIEAADQDDVEGIRLALIAFGDSIQYEGETIVPDELANWRIETTGDYRPRLPVNQIALWEAGINIMERSQRAGLLVAGDWVMEEVMGIEQPWEHFERAVSWRAATSPLVQQRLLQRKLEMWDVELAEEEGMTVEELEQQFQRLSPEQQARGGRAMAAARAFAARRAGTPFATEPGGPQPERTMEGFVSGVEGV